MKFFYAVAYCPRQFLCRLHSITLILAPLVTAWFLQRDGKASIRSRDARAHSPYCACNGEIVFWTVLLLSTACCTNIPPPPGRAMAQVVSLRPLTAEARFAPG
jgi:hypothetical protein